MKNLIIKLLRKIRSVFFVFLYKNEYYSQTPKRLNERPVEYAFVFKIISKIYPLTILDVGTGLTALPRIIRGCGFVVSAIDNIKDYWPDGMANRYYFVQNDDITNTRIKKKFDLLTCISVLEHIENFNDAIKNMVSLLNDGGYIILSFPYCENKYIKNVYELPGSTYGQKAPYITQSFSRHEINTWVKEHNLIILEQEYWRFWSGEHWTVGKQIIPPILTNEKEPHQISCILLQKNISV